MRVSWQFGRENGDWGHARDFVEMQWLMLQQDERMTYVNCHGTAILRRDFVNAAAEELESGSMVRERCPRKSVDGRGNCVVAVRSAHFRPAEVDTLGGDASKARAKLGWQPKVSFRELVAKWWPEI